MKRNTIEEETAKLITIVKERGGDAIVIPADTIITAHWVRMKCYFGCKGFGRRFSCPPYSPTPEETAKVISEFSIAILIRFDGDVGETDPKRYVSHETTHYVQTMMHDLEKTAFEDGFYKVTCYTGHQCGWCKSCAAKEKGAEISDCRFREKMRPSMEAAGIDAYATCRANGWELDVLKGTPLPTGGLALEHPMTTVMLMLLE
ncbi:MAG TPA: DUF2284 domain-containing protein [Methanocorpusculum sp.]|nr:DUF2284 domain-containing protein [Methanocorpusculum sp.]HJJ39682.1 DUF2284 domain-containing protein [Methanocorpusculum sp.]HJJ49291.1 DUF2284 domain-containing protein [Methanocorpusculum sp.]HJJ56665.1 DUF2284 domain-containing protein [Methanocorpusculum sp.]